MFIMKQTTEMWAVRLDQMRIKHFTTSSTLREDGFGIGDIVGE